MTGGSKHAVTIELAVFAESQTGKGAEASDKCDHHEDKVQGLSRVQASFILHTASKEQARGTKEDIRILTHRIM